MADTLTYATRYMRRYWYAKRHGLTGPWRRGTPKGCRPGVPYGPTSWLWTLPPEAEALQVRPPTPAKAPAPPRIRALPLQPEGVAPQIAGAALACCGWLTITTLPVECPGCGRRYLEGTP